MWLPKVDTSSGGFEISHRLCRKYETILIILGGIIIRSERVIDPFIHSWSAMPGRIRLMRCTIVAHAVRVSDYSYVSRDYLIYILLLL